MAWSLHLSKRKCGLRSRPRVQYPTWPWGLSSEGTSPSISSSSREAESRMPWVIAGRTHGIRCHRGGPGVWRAVSPRVSPFPGVVPPSRLVAIRSGDAARSASARPQAMLGIRRAQSSFLCYGVRATYLWSCGTVTAVLQVAEFPAASMPW